MSQRLVAVFTPVENLTDPRVKRSRQHELVDLVVVALCATLAGSDTWADTHSTIVRQELPYAPGKPLLAYVLDIGQSVTANQDRPGEA